MWRRPLARKHYQAGEKLPRSGAPDGVAGDQDQHVKQDQHELHADAIAALDRNPLGPVQRSPRRVVRVAITGVSMFFSGGSMHQTEPTIEEITASLPRRLHEVAQRYVVDAPDRAAMIEDGAKWTYRDLDRYVRQTAERLTAFGVRAGDRIMLVSENCIALAALLLAASRIDAWAIVSNPRLSARELDQIRDHSGARSDHEAHGRRQRATCKQVRPGRARKGD